MFDDALPLKREGDPVVLPVPDQHRAKEEDRDRAGDIGTRLAEPSPMIAACGWKKQDAPRQNRGHKISKARKARAKIRPGPKASKHAFGRSHSPGARYSRSQRERTGSAGRRV